MIKRDQSLATPYLQFDRTQWAALRDSVPLTLTEEEIVKLKGINEDLSLDEVAQIYLPLSRLLNFYISSNLRRQVFWSNSSGLMASVSLMLSVLPVVLL